MIKGNKKLYSIIIIASLLILTSCSPLFYSPNSMNVPLMIEKENLHVSGGYSNSEDLAGLELQTAYAFSQRFAIIANYSFMGSDEYDSSYKGKGKVFEFGLGHYCSKNMIVFENYIGPSWTKFDNKSRDDDYESMNAKIFKPFLLTNLGIKHKNLEFALSHRLAYRHYYNINYNDEASESLLGDIELLKDNNDKFISEVGATIKGGSKTFKLYVQGVLLTKTYLNEDLENDFALNFGVVINFTNPEN